MRSLGATGPTKLSVTGSRYNSGWAHNQRLKLRAKARGYCSPRPRETKHSGGGTILNSPCLPYRRGVPRHMNMAQGRNKGMVKKTRISEGKKNLRLGTTLPPPPPQGSRDGDIRPWRPGGSSGASLDQACSRTTFHLGPSWLLPIWLYPPSSETKYVLILLPSSTGTLAPITLGWEGWRSPGSKGYGSALPPAPPAHADSS
jgi:hypothetical protein